MKVAVRRSPLALAVVLAASPVSARSIDLSHATVLRGDKAGDGAMAIAADMLAGDLARLGGAGVTTVRKRSDCARVCIVVGLHDARAIVRLARLGRIDLTPLDGAWERHIRAAVRADGRTYLLIAGSDRRGAIYGAVDLSRALGVSPWEWWADVTARRRDAIVIDDATFVSRSPSVRYRGIFLNDEDWDSSLGRRRHRTSLKATSARTPIAASSN